MTAMEMDLMTMEMRNRGAEILTRSDLDNYAYYLMCGLNAIGRRELANQLQNLYDEMESVSTYEIYKIGTFRQEVDDNGSSYDKGRYSAIK